MATRERSSRRPATSSTWRGIRSPASSATSASTRRSTSTTARSCRVQEHVVAVPRLQRVHEGQGPARRALHHQPHLRHLRRQPRDLLGATRRTWPTASSRRRWPSGSSTSARPPSTCSTTSIFQDNLVFVDFCEQMVKETNPSAAGAGGEAPRRRTPSMHGYRTIADIMRSLQPVRGRDVPRGAADEPHRRGRCSA